MNIRLDRITHLEVDYQRNVGNVDTTTGEVRCDEDVALAGTDRVERRFALFLVFAGVEGRGGPLFGAKEEEDER